MDNDKLIFLDTETTTKEPDEAFLCAVAFKKMNQVASAKLFKPPVPITLDAMSVTHITNKMVQYEEPFEGSAMQKHLQQIFNDGDHIMVAHNAEFDMAMLAKHNVIPKQYICTMKCARFLDVNDEIPNYKMQYIRYAWDIEIEATAHDAKGDILVLEEIYKKLSEKVSIEEMFKITQEPFLLRRLTFGKYKGIPFAQIPIDYLRWLRQQDNIVGDLSFTINHYLGRRFTNAEHE